MRLETGGMIDRETLVTFTFDGKAIRVLPGIRWLQRFWPMVLNCWGARSNTIDRAGFLPLAAPSQTRW